MRGKLVGLTAACTLLALVVVLRYGMPIRALEAIRSDYAAGDLSAAVERVARLQDPDLDAQLLVANCFRQLGQNSSFLDVIDRLGAQLGPDNPQVDLVMALYKIQHGQLDQPPLKLVEVLQSAGADAGDAWSVVCQGALALGRVEEARLLLDRWEEEQPDSPQLAFLRAGYFNVSGLPEAAETELLRAIESHPRHELAWLALAELYSRPPDVRFRQAELVLETFLIHFPNSSQAYLRLAKIKRRLGEASQALALLSKGTKANSEASDVIWERAQAEFDLGHYAEAQELVKRLQLASPEALKQMTDDAFRLSIQGRLVGENDLNERVTHGASLLAFNGDLASSAAVFAVANDRVARLRRLQDVDVRRSLMPENQASIDEMNALISPAFAPNYPTLEELDRRNDWMVDAPPGLPIYQQHCAACHGRNGDGGGRAGSNLVPAPRNFRDEPLRLVSAADGLATDQDVADAIREGEVGTSMPAFGQLTNTDVELLVEVVRYFQNQGLREKYARMLAKQPDSGLSDEPQKVEAWIRAHSEPSSPLAVPEIAINAESVARGKQLFDRVGCGSCHSVQGHTRPLMPRLFDSLGRPVVAVDLAQHPFRGGNQAADVYKRLMLGIPGTPHPAVASLSEIDLQALVAYVVTIHETQEVQATTNFERGLRANSAVAVEGGEF